MSHVSFDNLVSVQCVHGDVKQYPQAEINVCVQDQTYLLNVAIVDDLPADMILVRDLPVLTELLHSAKNDVTTFVNVDVACPVVTRAQVKAGLQPLPDLHHSLPQGGTKGPRKTRRQRRLEKGLGTPAPKIQTEGLEIHDWQVPENIAELQRADKSLKPLFDKVLGEQQADVCDEKYVVVNDILYMQTPDSTRLVVPTCCRPLILHLAHSVPWAGHLALQKTYAHISSRFIWPSMYTEVQTYCTTCHTCQKTSAVRRQDRAPLHPLPVISSPFQRIAMDIVGPLEKSSTGHQYILVVSDYATRYPEAEGTHRGRFSEPENGITLRQAPRTHS